MEQKLQALVYNTWWFEGIMVLFAINFFGNIFKFKLMTREKLVVLVFHLAFFFIILGAGITRYVSFEGLMPIKEGQVSNTFLSFDNYVTIDINDGKEQKNTLHHKAIFSAMTENNIDYDTKFKDIPVSIELTNYIPNVIETFEESETGDEYLLVVESGGGGRHNHYLKRGASEVIHGVLIGFDSPNQNTINFLTSENGLNIQSAVDGSFFRMADSFQGSISKDSVQEFSMLAVHNVAGLQFVVPKGPIKGAYITKSGTKDESSLAQLEFDVTVNDETKSVKMQGMQYAIQNPTQFSVGGLNFRMNYGAIQLRLPFSVKLNDFILDKYPGSESAMSFASEVTVIDPEETFNFRIFMNNILIYKGYKFFQSGYSITEEYEETHLQVNHDFGELSLPTLVISLYMQDFF